MKLKLALIMMIFVFATLMGCVGIPTAEDSHTSPQGSNNTEGGDTVFEENGGIDRYSYVGAVFEGMAIVVIDADPYLDVPIWRAGGQWGVVDVATGSEVVPFGKYTHIIFLHGTMVSVTPEGGSERGVIDVLNGRAVVPFGKYDWIGKFDDGQAGIIGSRFTSDGMAVAGRDENVGVICLYSNGSEVLPIGKYSEIEFISSGMAGVMLDGQWGVINIECGTTMIPFGKYDRLGNIYGDMLVAQLGTGSSWGVVDIKSGEIILPFQYESIRLLSNNRAVVRARVDARGRYGIIDIELGHEVVPIGEYRFGSHEDGLIEVFRTVSGHAGSGIIEIESRDEIVPIGRYNGTRIYSDGIVAIVEDGLWRFGHISNYIMTND